MCELFFLRGMAHSDPSSSSLIQNVRSNLPGGFSVFSGHHSNQLLMTHSVITPLGIPKLKICICFPILAHGCDASNLLALSAADTCFILNGCSQ